MNYVIIMSSLCNNSSALQLHSCKVIKGGQVYQSSYQPTVTKIPTVINVDVKLLMRLYDSRKYKHTLSINLDWSRRNVFIKGA